MAQKEMVAQRARHEEDVGENFSYEKQSVKRALRTRQRTIKKLREAATRADRIYQDCAGSNRNASLTGVFGGVATMVAGGITIASGGLAFPAVIAGFTGVGATCSVGGGVWSIKNEIQQSQSNIDLKKEIEELLIKDEEELTKMDEVISWKKRDEKCSQMFRELHTFIAGLFGIGNIFGPSPALEILQFLLPRTERHLSDGTKPVLESMIKITEILARIGKLEGMDEAAEQSASSAVKFMSNGLSKDFVQRKALKAAQKAYTEAMEEVIEKAAKKAAQKAAKEGGDIVAQKTAEEAAKEAAKKAAKETATKAARNAASKAVQEGAKTVARITGAITMGFGALTSVWEGYNAYINHNLSQAVSPLGSELRDLADNLEIPLKGIGAA